MRVSEVGVRWHKGNHDTSRVRHALKWLLADLIPIFYIVYFRAESTSKLTNDKNVDKTLGEYG